MLLREEVGEAGVCGGGGGGHRGGGGGEVGLLGMGRGGGGKMVFALGRGGGGEQRDEDVADERRPGGEVDAKVRLEAPHDGLGRYPGRGAAGERGGLADDGLHVAGELLVGHHRWGGGGVVASARRLF